MTDAAPAEGSPDGAPIPSPSTFADRVAEDREARLVDAIGADGSHDRWHQVGPRSATDTTGIGLIASATFGVTSLVALLVIAMAPTVFFGWAITVIESSSMQPTIERGDIVLLRPVDERRVGVGSVVQFPADDGGSSIVHRIVEVDPEAGAYVTRGDANRNDDRALVPFDEIEGRGAILVPLIGHPALWFHEGRFLVLALVMAGGLGVIWGGLGTGDRRSGEHDGRADAAPPVAVLAGPPLGAWSPGRRLATQLFPPTTGIDPGRGQPRST